MEKPSQSLISFTDSPKELMKIQKLLDSGWSVVNILLQGAQYLAILEKVELPENKEDIVLRVPPRKKITIST
jgi:hypothetical protein